ncbi:MAG: phage scaffolding protein [Oscillospiraceae bacterium]
MMTKEQLLELGCPEGAAESISNSFAEQTKAHESEVARLKLDYAVEAALTAAGAKNHKAVKSLLNLDGLSLGEDGKAVGIAEQLAAVKASDGYLFNEEAKPVFRGYQPADSADGVPKIDANAMSYSQLSTFMGENPDFKLD